MPVGRHGFNVPGLLQDLLQALPVAAYTTDACGVVTFCNRAGRVLAGRAPNIGRDRWCISWRLFNLNGEHLPHEECPMAVALKEKRFVRGVSAIAERPDLTRVIFVPFPTPLLDASGRLTGGINILLDVVDSAQPGARPSLPSIQSHSTKTPTLRLIEGVLNEVEERISDPNIRQKFRRAGFRVQTIALVQSLFSGFDGETKIATSDLLSAIGIVARSILGPNVDLVCRFRGPDASRPAALSMLLVAAELIQNAAAHGPDTQAHIGVCATLEHDDMTERLVLVVENDGSEFVPKLEELHSGGLHFAAAIVRRMGGSFAAGPGSRCVVGLPDPQTYH